MDIKYLKWDLIESKSVIISHKKIKFPGKVTGLLEYKNQLLVRYQPEYIDEFGNIVTDEFIKNEIDGSNIWCFDLQGNLIWKAPRVVDAEKEKKTGPISYLDMEIKKDDENILKLFGGHGFIAEVELATGKVIKRYQGEWK